MFDKYLELGGVEIANGARFKAYVEGMTNDIDVKCDAPGLAVALGDIEYTTPQTDGAPWYRAGRPASARFLGVFPVKIDNLWNGTRTVTVTELLGPGAVQSLPRDASGEARVTVLLAAQDDEALAEGRAWFEEMLEANKCDDASLGCVGTVLRAFCAAPSSQAEADEFERNFYDVALLEGPRITEEYRSKKISMIKMEFILSIGKPWPVTKLQTVAMLDMDLATNHTDNPFENCSEASVAYDNFITDPFYTAIQLPPRPPVILPPNVLDISSWRRMKADIPVALSDRPGSMIPVVRVFAGPSGAQFVRVRFYKVTVPGWTGCDYDGEFLISYIPPSAVMSLDTIRREVSVTMPDGRVVPAGHLLFGTDGRPFQWPELGCHHEYVMTADMMPGQADVSVYLEVAVRE